MVTPVKSQRRIIDYVAGNAARRSTVTNSQGPTADDCAAAVSKGFINRPGSSPLFRKRGETCDRAGNGLTYQLRPATVKPGSRFRYSDFH